MTDDKKLTAYDVKYYYDEAYFADLSARYRERIPFARQRIANVLSLLPDVKGKSLLDVGCGMGTFAIETAARGAFSVGVDMMDTAIKAAQHVAKAEGVSATFTLADAANLPLEDKTTDVTIAADFTEHLDDATLERVLNELARVMKPGGTLIIYTPSPTHILERLREVNILKPDPSHIGLRTGPELSKWATRAGFKVTRLEYLPSHLPGLSLLERAFGRWLPLLRRRVGLVAQRA
jgi:ubiquinone/menaquinone biosynthesis C-methylase UbiE